jgi:nitroreductase
MARDGDMSMNATVNNETSKQALQRLLYERHSCRGFLPQLVPEATIRHILELAQLTASWCNTQPWQVVVTSGEATERFRRAMLERAATAPRNPDLPFPREYSGKYLERRRACGLRLYESVGIVRGDRAASERQAAENFRLFGAPHVAIITSPEPLGIYGAIDCGAYIGNFMLAAQSIGVASIAQAALAAHSGFIRDYFDLGNDCRVVCGISFGYEDSAHPANGCRTRRVGLSEAVKWVDK